MSIQSWFCRNLGIFCPKRPTKKVEECPVTKLLPNPYCPRPLLVEKYYVTPQGNEPVAPTKICENHMAPEPPFPPKSKKPMYFFVPELMVADGDIEAYLKKNRKSGAWGGRIFGMQSWSTKILLPYLQAEYESVDAEGNPKKELVWVDIPSEGLRTPVCDLKKENPAYWARLKEILALFKKYDLEIIFSLGDNCSQNTHTQFFTYPFLGAKQTMSSTEGWPFVVPQAAVKDFEYSPDGLYGVSKYDYFRAWIKKAVEALDESGVSYHLEIQNEFNRLNWQDNTPDKWYEMCLEACGNRSQINSGDWKIISNHEGIYSQHGVAKPNFNPVQIEKNRIMLSGDGARGNSDVDVDCEGNRGLSVEDAKTLAGIILNDGYYGYEYMEKRIWADDPSAANVDYGTTDVFDAMYSVFG